MAYSVDMPMANAITPSAQTNCVSHDHDSMSALRVLTETVHAAHNAVKAEDLSVFVGSCCLLANTELKIAEQPHPLRVSEPGGSSKTIQSGMSYGLVGVNGCGKSTLLRLIAENHVPVPPAWDVFLVSQHLPTPTGQCPVEEVLSADAERAELLKELASLEEQVDTLSAANEEVCHDVNARLLAVHDELSKWDGAEQEVGTILLALGFRRADDCASNSCDPKITTGMRELSGGWRMKVQLAKALWLQPKLLLLDEPTNHLDFQAIKWLQQKLEQYPHTTVVVSHDVGFLHDVCTEILWVNDLKLESLPRDAVSQEDLLRMQRKRLLKFQFSVPEGSAAENHGLSLHGVGFSYEGNNDGTRPTCMLKVKKEIRFSGKSRSVLLGSNGSGKSTFLDLCAGSLSPCDGHVDRTPDLKIGHYSQLTDELDRNSTDTAASFLARKCPNELATHACSTRTTRLRGAIASQTQQKGRADEAVDAQKRVAQAAAQEKRLLEIARAVLSRFGFEGDVAVSAPVDSLSGGQKALLKFAVLSLRPVHILLLDEPTNHLDAEACEALAKGLSEFKGGVVAVTHDELLIYRLIHCNWSASELLICRGGSVWCERNFGAHCLNALKKEVHRAEQVAVTSAVQGKQRRHSKESPAALPENVTVKTESGVLPPWLRTRARLRKIDDTQQSTNLGHTEPTDDSSIVNEMDSLALRKATPIHALQPEALSVAHRANCAEELNANECVDDKKGTSKNERNVTDVPDSCEESLDSDATTEAPDTCEQMKELDEIEAPEFAEHCSSEASPNDGCTGKGLPPHRLRNTLPQSPEDQVGHHSRFRKDLVNLNKAVLKWLRQEVAGEVSHCQVLQNIKDSTVAQQLQRLHGDKFDELCFVNGVLARAEKVSGQLRKCLQGER